MEQAQVHAVAHLLATMTEEERGAAWMLMRRMTPFGMVRCVVPGCTNPPQGSREACAGHRKRLQRTGSYGTAPLRPYRHRTTGQPLSA